MREGTSVEDTNSFVLPIKFFNGLDHLLSLSPRLILIQIEIEMEISRPERVKKDSVTPADWRRHKEKRREWKNAKLLKTLVTEPTESVEIENENEKNGNTLIKGRQFTLSIALPSSILRNAQSNELRTYLAGQIGRAASVFNIDEIVVFNDDETDQLNEALETNTNPFTASEQMIRLLEYLECPQYLRKQFFPRQKLLEYAGLLNPLDAPHHLRTNEFWFYREGVTLPLKPADGKGSWVDVGLYETRVQIEKKLQAGLRVTIQRTDLTLQEYFQIKESQNEEKQNTKKKRIPGEIVGPSAPRVDAGFYWGYQVRQADSIGTILHDCPFSDDQHEANYDLVIGTSERGVSYETIETFPRFRHAMIVFGGLQGLEKPLQQETNPMKPEDLFQFYINTCPQQGSRTIRTEEAVLISLSCLREKLLAAAIR